MQCVAGQLPAAQFDAHHASIPAFPAQDPVALQLPPTGGAWVVAGRGGAWVVTTGGTGGAWVVPTGGGAWVVTPGRGGWVVTGCGGGGG